LKIVDDTLKEFGSEDKIEIKVFNKVDAVKDKSKIEFIRNNYNNSVIISAQKGINISKLNEMLIDAAECSFIEDEISIAIEETKLLSQIHSLAEVISTKYDNGSVVLKIRASKENKNRIKKLIGKNGENTIEYKKEG